MSYVGGGTQAASLTDYRSHENSGTFDAQRVCSGVAAPMAEDIHIEFFLTILRGCFGFPGIVSMINMKSFEASSNAGV